VSGKASPPPGGDAEHEANGKAPPGDAAEENTSPEANGAADPVEATAEEAGVQEAAVQEATLGEPADVADDEADDEDALTEAGDEDALAEAGEEGEDGDGNRDAADAVLQAAADALEVDLELLLAEREQYLDAYRRAQADFENYRKQAQKRQDDAVVRSLGSFVEGLLPVLDSCDAALAHGASEVEPVLSALYGALAKEGLERIDPKGSAFDPAEADAVVHEPGEGGEQVVAEVLRPGYRWRGRVLRPAMVKVTD
jgi:molecular chaperone GrpE